MDSKNIVLNVNGIEVIYNHVILVLKGVSLQVPDGRIVALLGGNGAGKTTTLRAVSNLLKGERGDAAFRHLQRYALQHQDDVVVDDFDAVDVEQRCSHRLLRSSCAQRSRRKRCAQPAAPCGRLG